MSRAVPLIWTNDDISWGLTAQLKRHLELLDRLHIQGVFFVIPFALDAKRPIDDDTELMRTIDAARARGHEFYQHGYCHDPFESGVPETWMLDFDPPTKARYDEQRLAIEQQHTFEALIEMIDKGRRIWRRAFGDDSPGYRPGWGAFCGNLYRALSALGFEWCSARIPCPTSWRRAWNMGWDEAPTFRDAVPAGPVRIGRLWEYPMGGEYAFRVPAEQKKIDSMVELAMQELAHYRKHNWPILIVSHWHGLEWQNGTGYAVHKRLLPLMIESDLVEPMGMNMLHQRWTKAATADEIMEQPLDPAP